MDNTTKRVSEVIPYTGTVPLGYLVLQVHHSKPILFLTIHIHNDLNKILSFF